jgi:hypothetical protein
MRKGFSLPLIIVITIVLVSLGTTAYFQNKHKITPLQVPSQSPQTNSSPTPILQQSEPTSNEHPCIEDKIGDIKYKPPANWKKLDDKCDTRIYLTPGVEFNGFDPSKQEGAVIVIGGSTLAGQREENCALAGKSLNQVICTISNNGKLHVFRLWEGRSSALVYSIFYKGHYYEFGLSGIEEKKYQPVLEQIVNKVEYL